MDLVKQGQTTDIQFGLRMITGNGFIYGAKLIKLTNCTVVISDRFESVTWYYNNSVSQDSRYLSLPFANTREGDLTPRFDRMRGSILELTSKMIKARESGKDLILEKEEIIEDELEDDS